MDMKHERNQAAGPQEHSEFPPEELCLKTALNIANEKITTLEKKISDMEEFQRPAETEKPNLCQISEGDTESSFLVSIEELIGRRLEHIKRQQERESELVRLSNQQRDEMAEKYEAEAQKSKIIILDLFKVNEGLSLRLRESENELLMEKAEHLRNVEALEVKIKSLVENEDQDLKEQEIKELQDKHHGEVNELKEGMVNLSLTNKNLLSKLNDANDQLRVQEEPWKAKYDALDSSHEKKLSKTILSTRQANQATQKNLDKKFKAELNRNQSLLAQLRAVRGRHTLLEDSHKQLIDERTLLEDICLMLKKKCRGTFGRRMQEREVELAKMKRKMRETRTQTLTRTQTQTLTEMRTETQRLTGTVFRGPTRDAGGPRPLAPYSLRKRLKHLDN